MLQFLLAGVLCGCLVSADSLSDFHQNACGKIPEGGHKWKATITLSVPLQGMKVDGADVNYIRDDGLVLEATNASFTFNNYACFAISGKYTGDTVPVAEVNITPVLVIHELQFREVRVLRQRRAKTVWTLHSFPVTTNKKTLLAGFEPYKHQWGDDSISGSTKHSSDGALSVHYAKGSYSQSPSHRGVGWFTNPNGLPSDTDDLFLSYDIYYEDFGFGKMGKLPGLYGGVSGEGSYLCSGGNNPSSCFSLRLMWRSGGEGELYAYIPSNQESGFNNRPDVIANSDYGQSIGRGKIKFQNGVWQTVTEQVHLNTVGKTDGWVRFCNQITGQSQQCYTANNLRMRNSADHHLRGLFFSTFFGGSQPEDGAPGECRTYFKELKIEIPDGSAIIG